MKGKFYGIGVGPGDPELITLKAVNILKDIDIVICPKSKKDKKSYAFEIAERYLGVKTEILKLEFPMVYDKEILSNKWKENAKIIFELLEKGKNIAFLTIGDPMVYSTYMYLMNILKNYDIEIETVPGVTSFCAMASKVNIPLASEDETLCILPLRKQMDNLDAILDAFDNIVIMKPSHDNVKLAEKIEKMDKLNDFVLTSKCGQLDEEISYDVNRLKEDIPYLSTVILKKRGLRENE